MAGGAYAWSGFYVGAHAGYAFSSDRYDIDPAAFALGMNSVDLAGSRGFAGGVLGGYNVLFAQRWLAGIEADWSVQDIQTHYSTDPALGAVADATIKQKWAASVRGRLGYLVTPATLFYGTAGWAWSNVTAEVNTPGLSMSASATINGFQGGLGVETAITPNLHARLEYLETFFNSGALGSDFSTNVGLAGVKPTVGLARVAAVYQFGSASPATPAVAVAPRWTGFYVGGSLGGAVGYSNVHVEGVGDIEGVGVTGPVPSAMAGYNYQVAPNWIVGGEAEIAPSARSTDLKLGWLGAIRGRVGYLITPDTMVYGSAGWIGTQVDDLVYNGVAVVSGQTISGLELGGGLEVEVAPQWDLRFDYQYAIMQKINLTFPTVPAPAAATANPRGHGGKIALIRRFGD